MCLNWLLPYWLPLSEVWFDHSAAFGHMMKKYTKYYVRILWNITALHSSASLRGLVTTAKAENQINYRTACAWMHKLMWKLSLMSCHSCKTNWIPERGMVWQTNRPSKRKCMGWPARLCQTCISFMMYIQSFQYWNWNIEMVNWCSVLLPYTYEVADMYAWPQLLACIFCPCIRITMYYAIDTKKIYKNE